MEIQPSPILPSRGVASPSLASDAGGGDAFEVKYRLTTQEADGVQAWARERLTPDPHGENGVYGTTSLYLDTSVLDIYHKTRGYRRSKYRLRRYGSEEWVHMERKIRRGDRVRKSRAAIALAEVPRLIDANGGGPWFGPLIRQRSLRPICWISYTRTAFTAVTSGGPVRLTLDRDVMGTTASAWMVPAGVDGRKLLPGEVILELKFRSSLPALFHDLLGSLPSRQVGVSKYGRCVEAWNLGRR
ncbi:MAG TPA: polyphosphate polymerase domain-containing protein [Gemmataceae bacterium]|nr:polyphosphate polymerase domain-containing protein [Gemmataceae bacterium]